MTDLDSSRAHPSWVLGLATIILRFGLLGMVLLPLYGMWLWYHAPVGLFEPEPVHMDRMWPLIYRTLGLSAVVVSGCLFLGTFLAWAETRLSFFGRNVLTLCALMPLAVPSYLLAKILREVMAPAGWVGEMLGREAAFVGFWPAALCLTVTCTPYVHLLVAATLRRCPAGEEEAARSLGAPAGRIWLTVLAPRLRPTWAFSAVLVGLYVVSDFGAVAILNCEVLTWRLYQAHSAQEAVLLGTSLIAMVLPLLALVRLLHGETDAEKSLVQRVSSPRRVKGLLLLGSWAIHLFVVGIGVLLPILTMTHWVIQGLTYQQEFMDVIEPAWTSIYIAALGAGLTVLVALVLASMGAQLRGWKGAIAENSVYITSALPGILIAVGLFQLVLNLRIQADGIGIDWTGLRDAGVFLFMGFSMRFVSQGYAALKPALLRLDQTQMESAMSLGAGRFRRAYHVVLPAIRPSLLAAYALLFLSIIKELPITLMLIPPGESTLAYAIFDANNEGIEQNIGLAGLTLLCIAFSLQIALNQWRRHV